MTSANAIQKPARVRMAGRKRHVGILVLGMQGGGGGTLTKVLNILGCALPIALIGPGDGDDAACWEAGSTAALNDEILASAGSSWNDWGPINSDWHTSGIRMDMVERAAEIIREHKSLGPLFAMEDPSLCRVADLWLEAADAAGVDMRVVLMLRHPGEVAASLESRDMMAPGYGLLLWLRHALDAEYLSRGSKRAIARFDRLSHHWKDTIDALRRSLSLALPRNSQAAHTEVELFLAREMRHHENIADGALGLSSTSEWLKRTFDILLAWSEGGENIADHAELDRIRTEFDNAYPAFARLLFSSEYSGDYGTGSHLSEQLAEAAGRVQAFEQQAVEIEQLRLRSSEMASHVTALTESYEQMQARVVALQAEADALRGAAARAAELDGAVKDLRQRERDLENEARSIAEARDYAEASLEGLKAEIEALKVAAERASALDEEVALVRTQEREHALRAHELETKVLDARAEAEAEQARRIDAERERDERGIALEEQKRVNLQLNERVGFAENAVEQHEQELAKLLEQLKEIGDAAQAATETAGEERERRAKVEAELEVALLELRELAEKKSELEGRLLATESAALQRQEELAQLWSQLETLQTAAGASAGEVAAERDRRSAAEEQLAAALKDARETAEVKGKLEGQLRVAESALSAAEEAALQRQSELAKIASELEALKANASVSAAEIAAERDRRTAVEEQLKAALKDSREIAEERSKLEDLLRNAATALSVAEETAEHRWDELAKLTSELESLQVGASASAADLAAERERRSATEEKLSAALKDMRAIAEQKSNLEDNLRTAENALSAAEKESAKLQKEVAELWDQFGIVQSAAGASATEVAVERKRRVEVEAQLTGVMRDLRSMISEKADFEVRARVAETALASRHEELLRLSEQMAEAKEMATRSAIDARREQELRLEREKLLAKAEVAAAELRTRLEDLENAPSSDAAYAEIAQLTRMLEEREMNAASSGAARMAAEQQITEQRQELARLTALLSKQNSRVEGIEEHAEWLRDFTKVSEQMPRWWSIMPSSWRRKREHQVYRRAGVFDAEQYLELYPDVSMAGMDPVRHYILHGMAEGRTPFR